MTDTSLYLMRWLTLIAVFSLAAISPGPDFVMVVRNSLIHSRRAGILTACGLGLSILVHVTYTALGFAVIISQSVLLFNAIKCAGAAYLIYMGIKALKSNGANPDALNGVRIPKETSSPMSDIAAFRCGFLTNLLNPKATLFFLAVFSQIITPTTPLFWQIIYGLTCSILLIIWFSFVATLLTYTPVRNKFLRATKWIDRTCGLLMIALGIKVALATK
jgi:RhtB (resistance to homoserine/threonine) family protein